MRNYRIPTNLLSKGATNSKLAKNSQFDYESYILYLSPYNQNSLGVNLCPHASEACILACLFTAGRGGFNSVKQARINKTEYFLQDRWAFIRQLFSELTKINKKAATKKISVRLNGTSDIDFVKLFKAYGFEDITEIFSNIKFYDYTKSIHRVKKYIGSNYDLTFSRSESNLAECREALNMGVNVAVVFSEIPTNVDLIDGDQHDLRFLDKKGGHIVALKAKGKAKKDISGFVAHSIDF